MGRSIKIKLIIRTKKGHHFLGEWKPIKRYNQLTGYGKPTPENLSKWRDDFNQSLQPGGANEHLTLKHYLQTDLEIYNQFTHEVVCSHIAPMFEVIN